MSYTFGSMNCTVPRRKPLLSDSKGDLDVFISPCWWSKPAQPLPDQWPEIPRSFEEYGQGWTFHVARFSMLSGDVKWWSNYDDRHSRGAADGVEMASALSYESGRGVLACGLHSLRPRPAVSMPPNGLKLLDLRDANTGELIWSSAAGLLGVSGINAEDALSGMIAAGRISEERAVGAKNIGWCDTVKCGPGVIAGLYHYFVQYEKWGGLRTDQWRYDNFHESLLDARMYNFPNLAASHAILWDYNGNVIASHNLYDIWDSEKPSEYTIPTSYVWAPNLTGHTFKVKSVHVTDDDTVVYTCYAALPPVNSYSGPWPIPASHWVFITLPGGTGSPKTTIIEQTDLRSSDMFPAAPAGEYASTFTWGETEYQKYAKAIQYEPRSVCPLPPGGSSFLLASSVDLQSRILAPERDWDRLYPVMNRFKVNSDGSVSEEISDSYPRTTLGPRNASVTPGDLTRNEFAEHLDLAMHATSDGRVAVPINRIGLSGREGAWEDRDQLSESFCFDPDNPSGALTQMTGFLTPGMEDVWYHQAELYPSGSFVDLQSGTAFVHTPKQPDHDTLFHPELHCYVARSSAGSIQLHGHRGAGDVYRLIYPAYYPNSYEYDPPYSLVSHHRPLIEQPQSYREINFGGRIRNHTHFSYYWINQTPRIFRESPIESTVAVLANAGDYYWTWIGVTAGIFGAWPEAHLCHLYSETPLA